MASTFGAALVMLGLVLIGGSVLYSNSAPSTPTTLQETQQATHIRADAATAQGVGWIVAGLGFGLSLRAVEGDEPRHVSPERPPDPDLPPPLE